MKAAPSTPGPSERRAIEAELLAWMGEPGWEPDDARFERLALALFAWQFAHCAPYGRYCEGRGATPESVSDWREIPAVPTGAFKEVALRCFPAEQTIKTFRTSGTSTEQRGELHLDTLDLYEASLLATLRTLLFPDVDPDVEEAQSDRAPTIRVLAPSAEEAPDSSLSHMFHVLVATLGGEDSGFDVRGDRLDVAGLLAGLRAAAARHEPVALCGTAFAFVHLLEALERDGVTLPCPAGSRIMETGGFKGRSRELSQDDLYAALEASTGIPRTAIVNQYGMTELGSQFYDSVLVDPDGPRRKLGPPWARARIVDPETGRDTAPGAVGMIVVHDLANTGSVGAVQTADLGRAVVSTDGEAIGFEVFGRDPGAEARGCSIAADEMLGSAP